MDLSTAVILFSPKQLSDTTMMMFLHITTEFVLRANETTCTLRRQVVDGVTLHITVHSGAQIADILIEGDDTELTMIRIESDDPATMVFCAIMPME